MPVDLEYDYNAATKAMDIFSQEDIGHLKEWTQKLDKSKYVPKDLTNKQLLLFYNACYGNLDKTKTCIEKYYLYRKNSPEVFDGRVITSDELKPSIEALEFSLLPEKSCEGYDLIYTRMHNTEPSKYNFEHGVKIISMIVDACLNKRGPQPGYIFLIDMRGFTFRHIPRISLSIVRKFFPYVQEALPVRLKAIHVFNAEPVLDKVMLLIRPFIDKKLFDMIKFHHKNEDLKQFHKTVIPRSALPPDHGGTLPDTQILHKRCMKQLEELQAYFDSEEDQRKAALPDKKRDKAMEKGFKNLNID